MMGVVVAIVGTLAGGFGAMFALVVSSMRASHKGYQAGMITVVVLAGMLTGIGAFLLIVAFSSLGGGTLAVLAPLLFLLPASAALLLLPRRKPRRNFSVQRVAFPYVRIGQVLFVIGCCATAVLSPLSWWNGGSVWEALAILVGGLLMSLLMAGLFTVFGQPVRAVPSLASVLAADPRPPVVFMRAFERESQMFVHGNLAEYGQYSEKPRLSGRQTTVQITLDEYLKPPLERRIGPLVALGNPQDYFTPPGAVRAYFRDETWMEEFKDLAQRAGCLIVEASESSNLLWEFQYLRESNLHDKLFVFAEHPTEPYGPWLKLASRMAGIPEMSWQRFAATLNGLGYETSIGEPEFGSVIGFDANGRAHVLTSDADLPDEFVEPVADWLAGHRGEERCVETACAKCRRHVFKTRARSTESFVCRTCRAGSPVRQAAREVAKWLVTFAAIPVCIAAIYAVTSIPSMMGWDFGWLARAWPVLVTVIGVAWVLLALWLQRAERRAATGTTGAESASAESLESTPTGRGSPRAE